mmetsp:Transcript_8518/g.14668  ORF Transcript_8518/g.14668 Transcript_8518/m.14668 type:complete len:157 (-) Transcript_8518:126-596(-)|eukprot:CAMPEP_0196661368 /NCGR_PEP_ID=MMETSP1086-20130531/43879_1 /TAXON_ID=77921 /ORGANISM="Cyanoptyche  gloeocystis , Strain SAG4.97" /LENGTH=156 /DNA_ID=CAMNT_0041996221 /DNA_START=35 /DNA_END=505 /DNA_ORIENTATION=-
MEAVERGQEQTTSSNGSSAGYATNARQQGETSATGGTSQSHLSKVAWCYQGHLGHRACWDVAPDEADRSDNPTYRTSNSQYGAKSMLPTLDGEYPPASIAESIKELPENGYNGRFTIHLAAAGMPRYHSLNTCPTRSKVVADPTHWGTQKFANGAL